MVRQSYCTIIIFLANLIRFMQSNSKLIAILLLFSLLGTLHTTNAQTIFKILDKAEKLYQKGFIHKALRKIEFAEKNNDCICGSCAIHANTKANLLRYKIHYTLKEYPLALNAIDAIDITTPEYDSLKIIVYQAQVGKTYLANNIDSSLANSKITCNENACSCYIELSFKASQVPFRLKLGHSSLSYIYGNQKAEIKAGWLESFKNSSLYRSIKQHESFH